MSNVIFMLSIFLLGCVFGFVFRIICCAFSVDGTIDVKRGCEKTTWVLTYGEDPAKIVNKKTVRFKVRIVE